MTEIRTETELNPLIQEISRDIRAMMTHYGRERMSDPEVIKTIINDVVEHYSGPYYQAAVRQIAKTPLQAGNCACLGWLILKQPKDLRQFIETKTMNTKKSLPLDQPELFQNVWQTGIPIVRDYLTAKGFITQPQFQPGQGAA